MRDHDQLDGDDARPEGFHLDRRKLLVGGAVGGAAAWAAPSILSMSAAAAASAGGGSGIPLPPSPGTGPHGISPIPYTALTLNNPTTVIAGPSDDGFQTYGPLPFPFKFYGVDYNSVLVGVNGFIAPDLTIPGNNYNNTPLSALGAPLIAVLWDDLYLPVGSTVVAQAFGAAPNRYVVFRWEALRHFNNQTPPGPFVFDVVLYETSQIDFIYTNVVETDPTNLLEADLGQPLTPAQASNGNSATIGVQGYGAFTQHSFHNGLQPDPQPNPVTSLSALRITG